MNGLFRQSSVFQLRSQKRKFRLGAGGDLSGKSRDGVKRYSGEEFPFGIRKSCIVLLRVRFSAEPEDFHGEIAPFHRRIHCLQELQTLLRVAAEGAADNHRLRLQKGGRHMDCPQQEELLQVPLPPLQIGQQSDFH